MSETRSQLEAERTQMCTKTIHNGVRRRVANMISLQVAVCISHRKASKHDGHHKNGPHRSQWQEEERSDESASPKQYDDTRF